MVVFRDDGSDGKLDGHLDDITIFLTTRKPGQFDHEQSIGHVDLIFKLVRACFSAFLALQNLITFASYLFIEVINYN